MASKKSKSQSKPKSNQTRRAREVAYTNLERAASPRARIIDLGDGTRLRRRRRRYRRSATRQGELPVLVAQALELMESHGRRPTDVLWVGTHDGTYAGTWDEFKAIKKIIYRTDLVITGDGWWLVRLTGYARGRISRVRNWMYIEPPHYKPNPGSLADCMIKAPAAVANE